jgi:transglutaminase-like putative cysteine protease
MLLFVCIWFIVIQGEEIKDYDCTRIPESLLKNSDAVIRDYSIIFRVENIEKANLKCHYVVSILNPRGSSCGQLLIHYNKFSEVKKVKGKLYNARGKEIRKVSGDEIHDSAIITWATLYSDNRTRYTELYHNEYPYTVEYEYEINYKGYINWPVWMPQDDEAAVEYSSYTIILPADSLLRYYRHNTELNPIATPVDKKYTSYKWEISSLPPFKAEPYGPLEEEQGLGIITAPLYFKLDDYAGSFASWNSFGKWYRDLSLDRQSLPSPAVGKIHTLVDGISDQKEKIKKIYKFMQSKTRYVNINAGLSGWQPVDAENVYENGYGDCKALTNFMISLLRCVDIKAYPVLIFNNPLPTRINQDFPHNRFNHVIACVPCDSDTIWLECTNPAQSFGQIGAGNQNRFALLITDEGGKLVKTPASSSTQNGQIRRANITLNTDGTALAEIETIYKGNQKDALNYLFSEAAAEEIENWLKNNLEVSSYRLERKDFKILNSEDGTSALTLYLTIPRYASVSGSRIFFKPNILERHSSIPDPVNSRIFPVMISYPYCDIDSITYQIPPGYIIEAIPKPAQLETDFAEYISQIGSTDDTTIRYHRRFEFKLTQIAPQKYESFREWMKAVVTIDNLSIVLIKK